MEWQPIETADTKNPIDIWVCELENEDGKLVNGSRWANVRFEETGGLQEVWEQDTGQYFELPQNGYVATHWMPIPAGPAQ